MKRLRTLFIAAFFMWTCLLGACRTTGNQLYSPVPIPVGPYTALSPETDVTNQPISAGSKVPFLLLTLVILTGLVMVFASDKKPKKRKSPASSHSRKTHKRAKKAH